MCCIYSRKYIMYIYIPEFASGNLSCYTEPLIRKEFTAVFIATLHQTHVQALSFHKYSTASDIWSYGVLLYEIWSIGQKPFVGKTNGQVMEVLLLTNSKLLFLNFFSKQTLQLVEGGFRLAPPPGCPRALYQLMIQCW